MGNTLSTGIDEINHELTQGPEGAQRALQAWMLLHPLVSGPDFRRNSQSARRINTTLTRILDTGIDPDYAPRGIAALCLCAAKDNVRGMRRLVRAGASLGLVASSTALVTALVNSRDEATLFALKAGCDPNQPNAQGTTPAMAALQAINFRMLEVLFARGATLNPLASTHPHPVAQVISLWAEEGAPLRMQAQWIKRLVEIPGCVLDVDAPCEGTTAIEAIKATVQEGGAQELLAQARQIALDRLVDASAIASSSTPLRRM